MPHIGVLARRYAEGLLQVVRESGKFLEVAGELDSFARLVESDSRVRDIMENPVYGELVWDADVQPEGLATAYRIPGGDLFSDVTVRAGQYVLLEQNNAQDAYASVGQVSSTFDLGPLFRSQAAVAYYYYSDATPDGSTALLADNGGNATLDRNGDGKADYGTLQQLCDQNLLDEKIVSGSHAGYSFKVEVTAGAGETEPGFTCIATPLVYGETGYNSFFVDQTGDVRMESEGKVPTAESPSLE